MSSFQQKKKDPIIYSGDKEYEYTATFTKGNGDVLTVEKIILSPKGKPWLFDRNQISYKEYYYPDTLNLLNFKNPVNRRREFDELMKATEEGKGKAYFGAWTLKSKSGAIENDHEVWTHPFRKNQYVYTEIAPFPEVIRDSLSPGKGWTSSLSILSGWDNFIGEVDCIYSVLGKKNYQSGDIFLEECWNIDAQATHSTLGVSTSNFLFHSDHGFVQLNYEFYDGVKIEFRMTQITTHNSK